MDKHKGNQDATPEIFYDWFLQKYGLQNVADTKFKRFLVALRLYSEKDAAIKLFAQKMKLM